MGLNCNLKGLLLLLFDGILSGDEIADVISNATGQFSINKSYISQWKNGVKKPNADSVNENIFKNIFYEAVENSSKPSLFNSIKNNFDATIKYICGKYKIKKPEYNLEISNYNTDYNIEYFNSFYEPISTQSSKNSEEAFDNLIEHLWNDFPVSNLEYNKWVTQQSQMAIGKKNLCPIHMGLFVGRENDIQILDESVRDNMITVIKAVGGQGKSVLAKKYTEKYSDKFNLIIFFDAKKEYNQVISEIEKQVNRSFDKIPFDEQTLLIIDNLNCKKNTIPHEYFNLITNIAKNSHIIITTRNAFSLFEEFEEKNGIINVIELKGVDSLILFRKSYKLNLSESDEILITKIGKKVNNHTLFMRLLGKLAKEEIISRNISLTEFLHGIDERVESIFNNYTFDISDDENNNGTVLELIKRFFPTKDLSEEEKTVLSTVWFFDFCWLKAPLLIKNIFENDSSLRNTLTALCSSGWIEKNKIDENVCYSLHPIIHTMISNSKISKIKGNLYIEGYINNALQLKAFSSYTYATSKIHGNIHENEFAFLFFEHALLNFENYKFISDYLYRKYINPSFVFICALNFNSWRYFKSLYEKFRKEIIRKKNIKSFSFELLYLLLALDNENFDVAVKSYSEKEWNSIIELYESYLKISNICKSEILYSLFSYCEFRLLEPLIFHFFPIDKTTYSFANKEYDIPPIFYGYLLSLDSYNKLFISKVKDLIFENKYNELCLFLNIFGVKSIIRNSDSFNSLNFDILEQTYLTETYNNWIENFLNCTKSHREYDKQIKRYHKYLLESYSGPEVLCQFPELFFDELICSNAFRRNDICEEAYLDIIFELLKRHLKVNAEKSIADWAFYTLSFDVSTYQKNIERFNSVINNNTVERISKNNSSFFFYLLKVIVLYIGGNSKLSYSYLRSLMNMWLACSHSKKERFYYIIDLSESVINLIIPLIEKFFKENQSFFDNIVFADDVLILRKLLLSISEKSDYKTKLSGYIEQLDKLQEKIIRSSELKLKE